ncbi:hypothetical protein M9Y10_007007 [Tritrichomonas musculus]|uniref:Tetraspanin family protein n=1 Tax=Tritrichomonas musculus TaxID=1915356 RepID=A0ABR2J188_9EUKA
MGCRCCTAACLGTLTIFTIGLTFMFMIFATYISSKARQINDSVFIVLIVATCITGIVLIFAIYASCCGGRCARGALGTIYLAYAIVVLACAVIVLIFRSKFSKFFRDSYNEGKLSDKDIEDIEKSFNCQFPNSTANLTILESNTESCFTKYDDFVKKFGLIIGIVLIVLFVLIFIGVVIACREACKKTETSSGSKTKEQVSTPLTYGW